MTVPHSPAFPVRSLMTHATFIVSNGKTEGCNEEYKEHCERKVRQEHASPENRAGGLRRGPERPEMWGTTGAGEGASWVGLVSGGWRSCWKTEVSSASCDDLQSLVRSGDLILLMSQEQIREESSMKSVIIGVYASWSFNLNLPPGLGPYSRPFREAASETGCFNAVYQNLAPADHPVRQLHTLSMGSILQAVSPRTVQTYWTAWSSFKNFHRAYNFVFPDFTLLSISPFISHLHNTKSIQPGTIKVYLSGVHFFFKLIHGQQCPSITNPQIALFIKGLHKMNPTRPDTRQPLTIDILTKCLVTLRSGIFSPNNTRTLDAMFNLAFFGFLRISELTINSTFNPAIHPTFPDLQFSTHDTIRFNIKQSKTDQLKHGHSVFIFSLATPIQPYQSLAFFLFFLLQRNSEITSPLDPLFANDKNLPVSRHWFQKNLKI
ncbi:uncharacterized protein LOC127411101 [Myxocyprinus asiaticus]|uniref:uncharacterized protein LOC127411101 n=1 Tax=Myxocyprinus asiaticus TaxID=70543 RepID=UPI0022215BEE|nr:uncharacterized protein LOC127411101 [Myxocyprinus asiaticus]